MPSLDELSGSQTSLRPPLLDGLEQLALNQDACFQRYTRLILPVDGYVFWQPTLEDLELKNISLHFAQEIQQNPDETYGAATVTLTAPERIVEFEQLAANSLYIGGVAGFRYAFAQQTGFYRAAGLWHYYGRSIAPALEALILDPPNTVDTSQAVTSNSLALWLALNTFTFPALWAKAGLPGGLTLFPAGLVPPNTPPPYGAVEISDTRALQAIPILGKASSSSDQLNTERVKLTLYGLQHNDGTDVLKQIILYSQIGRAHV